MISLLKFGKNEEVFSAEMENIKAVFKQSEVSSVYNPRQTNVGNRISWNLWEAVKFYYTLGRNAFVGKTKDGYVAELDSKDGLSRQLVYLKNTGREFTIYASVTSDKTNPPSLNNGYMMADSSAGLDGFNGTAILLALLPFINNDTEAAASFNELRPFAFHEPEDNFWTQENAYQEENLLTFSKELCLYTDNVYRRMKESVGVDANISIKLTEQRDIKMLTLQHLKKPVETIVGNPYFFKVGSSVSLNNATAYLLDNRDYTAEEEALIPKMPDSFNWKKWMMDTAGAIKVTSKYAEPIRTVMLVGPAGTGKSLGSMALAQLLGLPYDHVTCNPGMELFDFIGQIFPNTSGGSSLSFEDVRTSLGLPSVDDITNDPAGSFIRMHKMPYNGISEAEIIQQMIDTVMRAMKDMCDTKDYTYVEGGLIKAIRHGYLFEVQEIGIIKRPGVAVGLNALLESGTNNFITLPTGEVVKKHPNTVIVFTSNDGYEGTANLNQSVLSRMARVVWFDNPTVQDLKTRCKALVSDFPDDTLLLKMAQAIEDLNNLAETHDITDGVCGQRELNNWAMEIMVRVQLEELDEITNDIVRECCQVAVLNKFSQCEEDILTGAQGVIDPIWGEYEIRTK